MHAIIALIVILAFPNLAVLVVGYYIYLLYFKNYDDAEEKQRSHKTSRVLILVFVVLLMLQVFFGL